eukprot:TRINITY_DN10694_c0_g1_i1.p1 TRINITY_DN10694_c0_g1~~TRINITY_DN10694_c0_g1_i1.p1  ORF type:complete len:461 (+),score=43.06 TRINITY_DN10694_c0_g1_i1:29-1384(+)
MKSHIAFLLSIIIMISLLIVMTAMGLMRDWNTITNDQGETVWSFYTIEDNSRFLPEPNVSNPLDQNISGRSGENAASNWYYWKLPEPTIASRAFVWTCYVVHQVVFWGILYVAQRMREKGEGYSRQLKWYNVALLGCTLFFHVLHLFQTHVSYDGMAQDVSESSSQSSVILILVMILLIEYKHRGIIFGYPESGNFGIFNISVKLARKYHGYLFSWGAIYTFWYHPMESTVAHFFGFMHTAMLMIQGSFIYTDVHKNVYWRLLLEVWVLFHGTCVAFQQQQAAWTMFCFGFGFMLFFTQIYGLPIFKGTKWFIRIIPAVIFLIFISFWYILVPSSQGDTYMRLVTAEPLRIPLIEYLALILLAFALYIFHTLRNCCGESVYGNASIVYSFAALLIMVVVVIISTLIEALHVTMALITLMIVLVLFFSVAGAAVIVLIDADLKKTIKPVNNK